jgi:DNA polymerase I-like protein with 3'-5' exonuclease and polymerase domains
MSPSRTRAEASLRAAVATAVAQGARFWVRGAEIATDAVIPPEHLTWLWHSVVDERPYLDLLDRLGVTAMLVETHAGLRAAIRDVEQDKRLHGRAIGIDLETTPAAASAFHRPPLAFTRTGALAVRQPSSRNPELLDSHVARIATLQLYAGGATAFVFRGAALDLLLASRWLRRQYLVAHNAGFELRFFLAVSAHRSPRRAMGELHCTVQSSALLLGYGYDPEPRSLRAAAKQVLGLDIAKSYALSDWSAPVLSPGQLAYAAADAVLTRRIHLTHMPQLSQQNRRRPYDLQRGCIPAVAAMEHRGIGFDRQRHMEQVRHWEQERGAARRAFEQETGHPVPSTRSEIARWIETVLPPGMQWPRTASGKELSTAEAHLKRLGRVPAAHPLLRVLQLDKLLSAFGMGLLALINPVTGRLHPNYRIAGAKSGRFACANPNLQQFPSVRAPDLRKAIVAADGHLLLGGDWNQVEFRGAGFISGEPRFYELFARARDLHRETAARIARVAYDQVTDEQRKRAKAISFGALYGMQAPSLAEYAFDSFGVTMTALEAQQQLDRLALAYPKLHQWKRAHYQLCQRRGYVEIGCGRVVKAEWEAKKSIWFALCCNLPIQGICADAMMRAIQLVHKRLREARLDAFLVATVHDELLIEARERDAQAAAEILQSAMMDAFVMTFPGFPTVNLIEVQTGTSWAELKSAA